MKLFSIAALIVMSWLGSNYHLNTKGPPGYVIMWGVNLMNVDTNVDVPLAHFYSTGVVQIAGEVLSNGVAVAAGGANSLALGSDGTVISWPIVTHEPSPQVTSALVMLGDHLLSDVVAIAVSHSIDNESFSLALKRDGSVAAWGGNRFGQSTVPVGLSSVTAIAAGAYQALALKKDYTITSWGIGNPPPPGLSNVVAIAAGGENGRNLALKRDGTLVQWALGNVDNPSAMPVGLSNIVAVSSGVGHCLALNRDGSVVEWGLDGQGGPVFIGGKALSNVAAISAGNQYSLALKTDGTVVKWADPPFMKLAVPSGLSNVVAIAAGGNFCLAITTNPAVAARFLPKK